MDVIISTSLLSTPTSRAVQALPPSSPALLAPRLALGKVIEFARARGGGGGGGGGGATSGSSSSSSSPGSRPPLGAAEAAASVFLESPRAPGALHTCPAAGCGYSTSVRSTYHRHLRCHPAQKAVQACDSGGGGGSSGARERERERERAACCSESGGCGAMHCSGSSEGGATAELELEAASEAFRASIMAMRETDRTDQRALDVRRAAAAAAGHPEPEFAFEKSASI